MFKIIDRYLIRHFLQALVVVTLAIGLTIIVINMVEELRDFVDHDVPLTTILEYYGYFAGWVVKTFLPMFVLLALLFSVSILARRSEILAMKASGLSLYRLLQPLLLVTALLAVGHFFYNEYLFPPANRRRVEIKEFTIEARSPASRRTARNVFRRIGAGYFYTIGNFDIERGTGNNFRLQRSEGSRLRELVTADQIVYEHFRWKAIDGIMRTFNDPQPVTFARFDTLELIHIVDKPQDFAKRVGKPEDMSLEELSAYIKFQKRTGGPFMREYVDLRLKYAYPLASVIVVLISVPFAASPRRGGVAVSFATGALIALIYFVLFRVSQSAAYSERIPTELGIWGVNALFLVAGIGLVLFARK